MLYTSYSIDGNCTDFLWGCDFLSRNAQYCMAYCEQGVSISLLLRTKINRPTANNECYNLLT